MTPHDLGKMVYFFLFVLGICIAVQVFFFMSEVN